MSSTLNIATQIDGYKLDHRRQYPAGTTGVYSNWTPRSSRIPGVDRVVFLGLQYFLREHLGAWGRCFFDCDVDTVCANYERRVNGYLGPNEIGSQHIRDLHKLGYLPLEFRAIPEGSTVPLRVPMLTVENTHPDFAWLVNYFETIMSNVLWMPCTSATTARRMRQLLDAAAARTGSPAGFVDWQGHDFSFRGMAGPEAAALSGMGHLLYFTGTDTIPAIDLIEEHYATAPGHLIGGSVAATEHSVMCAGGEECELDTFDRLLKLYPSGVVSVVSDTWDLWHVLTSVLPKLRGKIMERPGKLVIRPDSGDPVKIICGDRGSLDPSARAGVIALLWDAFGGTTTETGHRLLDQHIGCIYGDSINFERAKAITEQLAANGFASANMVFGMGSYGYQYVTRDTFGFAMKATCVKIDGKWIPIFKAPKTDDGTKNSAKGRLAVAIGASGDLVLMNEASAQDEKASLLRPVWRNGDMIVHDGFDVIRARAREDLKARP